LKILKVNGTLPALLIPSSSFWPVGHPGAKICPPQGRCIFDSDFAAA
jgi:hypothetical protein